MFVLCWNRWTNHNKLFFSPAFFVSSNIIRKSRAEISYPLSDITWRMFFDIWSVIDSLSMNDIGSLSFVFSETILYTTSFSFCCPLVSRKYSMGTPKYCDNFLKLSIPGSDLPAFQFEKAVWLIPVSFDIWYVVLLVLSNNFLYFSYKFTPPFSEKYSWKYFRSVIYFQI